MKIIKMAMKRIIIALKYGYLLTLPAEQDYTVNHKISYAPIQVPLAIPYRATSHGGPGYEWE
ncbi:hypothetical protein GCM10011361_03880 [Muriicola marianensis]|uniref:Uncharacterized protein n=1 Tax=Muriicola marianensis TaxID=1324801 RepID=A0ABQ1QQR8_9FLAO|nr:hypothetical protein GCM10011361_03880 [Muriicola marianensis]